MMRRSALIAAVVALSGTVHAQALGAQPADVPASDPTAGVWRSRGYGYVVSIDAAGAPKLFHAIDGVCYADPRPDVDPDGVLAVRRAVGPDLIALSPGPSDTA